MTESEVYSINLTKSFCWDVEKVLESEVVIVANIVNVLNTTEFRGF